jgi:tetratricopeptide (TPR) repeat protein
MTGKSGALLAVLACLSGCVPRGAEVKAPAPPSSEALAWQKRAVAASKSENWPEVVRTTSVAIDDSGEFVEAYVLRSQAYIGLGRRDEAAADIASALALEPGNPSAINNRAVIERDSGARSHAESDFTAACQDGLQLACNNYKILMGYIRPERTQALIHQSVLLYERGDWEGVIRVTSVAIALDPKLAWAYVNRSGALANEGQLGAAIANANDAIALDPDLGLAYFNKAYALSKAGKDTEASLNYGIACRLHVMRACALGRSIGDASPK